MYNMIKCTNSMIKLYVKFDLLHLILGCGSHSIILKKTLFSFISNYKMESEKKETLSLLKSKILGLSY